MATDETKRPSLVSICALVVSVIATIASVSNMQNDRAAKRISNLISIDEYLHQPEYSNARHLVRDNVTIRSAFDDDVRRVCSSMDFAGSLVRYGAVDEDLFIDYWGQSLLRIDQRLEPLWEKDFGSGDPLRVQYKNFYWLIQEAKKSNQRR